MNVRVQQSVERDYCNAAVLPLSLSAAIYERNKDKQRMSNRSKRSGASERRTETTPMEVTLHVCIALSVTCAAIKR